MKIPLPVRSLFWVCLCPGTVGLVLPWVLWRHYPGPLELGAWHWAGLPLALVGVGVLGSCVLGFAREGQGTLSPLDPPKFVVRGGLYRRVRNPMYLGVLTAILGEGLFLQSGTVLLWCGFAGLAFHLVVLLYEEPALKRAFGEDYEAYRRAVPRWLPSI